ncbi:MAG TPA: acyltransferase [Anaerolineae bacterium]|nr:acyltransferase [Anaerolineae bacterium]HID83722.1 acyltransferase [Anaerolineales bacterium]HIQ08653.1 acyltransferase [Anaerolineaceae bacterium]
MNETVLRGLRVLFPRLKRIPIVRIHGRGNRLQYRGAVLLGVVFDIHGDDNEITIAPGAFLRGVRFHLRGSGHRVHIGAGVRISRRAELWLEDEGGELTIGPGTTIVSAHLAVTEPGSRLVIGPDCMLATDIEIRTGDSHAIFDAQTGERLNPAADVVLEEHVWVGARAIILKGCRIGKGSVVAAGAVVTQSCPPQSIVAGNPARVIRQGIVWTRHRQAKIDHG